MSTQNTRISKSRCGMKLPFERADAGDGYAASSEVKTYHMSPEEIAKRYPAQPKQQREKPPAFVQLNQYQKGVNNVSRLDVARKKLGRGDYIVEKRKGKTDREIMAKYFGNSSWGDVLTILKKEWLFTAAEMLEWQQAYVSRTILEREPEGELIQKMQEAALDALAVTAEPEPEQQQKEDMDKANEGIVITGSMTPEIAELFHPNEPAKRSVPVLELIVEIEMLKNRMATDQKRIDYINGVLANTMVEM